jgi:hypothetical protein
VTIRDNFPSILRYRHGASSLKVEQEKQVSAPNEDLSAVLDFVKRTEAIGILSTGAKVVDYKGGLYNVSGSTHDPKAVNEHRGRAWKALLIEYGIRAESECYVSGEVLDNT